MRISTVVSALCALAFASAAPAEDIEKRAVVKGFDVSDWQPNVNFPAAYKSGMRFVIIKATEGSNTIDSTFSKHWTESTSAGFIRGGYHFAQPTESSGAQQAEYFLAHGGDWSADGKTLPGALDLEVALDGWSHAKVVDWIADFVNTYHAKTKRYPILYFSPSWWETYTGSSTAFSKTCPLYLAAWGDAPEPIVGGWATWTFWQNADTNPYGGDSDEFNGALKNLQTLAKNG